MAGDVFPFVIQQQEQDNWCWVATTVSVAAFYEPGSLWEQCFWVDDALGTTNCCTAGSTPACNQPWPVSSGLIRVGHLDRIESGTATELEPEIAARRPVVTAILWSGGGGHAPLINGYGDVVVSLNPFVLERYLYVQDPFYGSSFVSYNSFRMAYQGLGRWVRTYYTK